MSSFEQRYYLGPSSLPTRLARDVRLLWNSLCFLCLWATRGYRVRRAYRRAQESGEEVLLEDLFPGPQP